MDPMIELCDIIAKRPDQFRDKLAWICGRSPQLENLQNDSPRASRSQLNAVIAVARFLSKCPHSKDDRPISVLLEFIRAVPSTLRRSFWPQSYKFESIASFYVEFLKYVYEAANGSPDLASEIAEYFGEVVTATVSGQDSNINDPAISRAFVLALSDDFPPVLASDADQLIDHLFQQLTTLVPASQGEVIPGNSEIAAAQANGGSSYWNSCVDQLNFINDEGGAMSKQVVASFEEESLESLEKQEVVFKMLAHVLEKVRKRDWTEQGQNLKSKINAKLSVYRAAARMQIKSLVSLDVDAKTSKKLVLETLALLVDAADACLLSQWRKLRACEDLFTSLLSGIAQVAVSRGGQPLRVLLIRLKPLVLAACMQACIVA
ncbi:hypothetical protein V6N13_018648 [Hibiscus sabdariffa]|uniref:PI4-kinase N-terminal domain-containing protein n=1 Tax=Hibiscus sabdariffa TaxID=183260 RepID=A0ABR2ELN9_9ROSI